ncbi:hypothetical protein E8P82_01380 [Arthrobacter echini]|uniref:Uncharacterized protein n=1 Tax=Arthrobacter echini TaxID=1529066 RepID=A0A4V3Z601_9MICC|nr:hypothetical protein [Arthrobacter echini]THJ68589.1 hypothetical protein E8P82_01380 [Arthrobacter echini]
MSTPGTRNPDDDGRQRADTPQDPTEAMDLGRSSSGSSTVGSAGSTAANDDDGGDYVPGMYSDSSADTSPTRQTPAPVSASKDTDSASSRGPRTQENTRVVPVTVTRTFGDPGTRGTDDFAKTRTATVIAGGPSAEDRKILHQREKEHFSGMKFGSGFFGWLTATGMFVLLTGVIGAIAALVGAGSDLSTTDITNGSGEAQTAGIVAAVIFGVALLISYFAGGYVAGRMARFSGAKQGVAVWLWAVIAAVIITIISLIVGNQTNVTAGFRNLNLPSIADLTVPGLITLLVVAAIALLGAVLGGLAGMRYHRRVDRTDYEAIAQPETR